MSDPQLKLIGDKLDTLIRLQIASLTIDKSQNDQISLLSKAGFQPKTIAELIGTTPNAVRVFLSRTRRRQNEKFWKGVRQQ